MSLINQVYISFLWTVASPSESANFYSNAADSNSPKSYELTAVATTPTSEDSNHLETLVTNPLYGNPNNPPQLSDSAAIPTSVSQTPLSPGTLHKLDNPLYGDPTENPLYGDPTERPTDIYSEPTAIQMGGTQNVDQYDYVTTAGKVVLSIVESHTLNYPSLLCK